RGAVRDGHLGVVRSAPDGDAAVPAAGDDLRRLPGDAGGVRARVRLAGAAAGGALSGDRCAGREGGGGAVRAAARSDVVLAPVRESEPEPRAWRAVRAGR